jgi:adenosylmethionine-8-amino-7-oxononanoate aminotransferase
VSAEAIPANVNTDLPEQREALLRRVLTREYPRAVRGRGVYLWDSDGKRYLDFCASAVVNFIGHGDVTVVRAMAEQASSLEFGHSSQFVTPAAEGFAREILEFCGDAYRGGAVFFTSGGSEAVESALKLARQYHVESGQTRRHQIISRTQSYHGATLGAMAVSGNLRRREIYLPMLREFAHIGIPYCYRCAYACNDCARKYADELEQAIAASDDQAAAFIFEPISGATLGAVAPPDGYVQRIADTCREHGLLLIADEVMTGFGRTGRNLAVDHWGVSPDIVVLAKGLASGYAPIGAVVVKANVVEAIANGSGALVHGFTYNAHPVCAAAGRAVLARMKELELVAAADSSGEKSVAHALADALGTLRNCRSVGDVRGLGLLWAIEFVRDRATKEPFPATVRFAANVGEAALRRGVMLYPMQGCVDGYSGDHVVIAPPAVITRDQITTAVERVRDAIEEVEKQS